MNEEREKQGKEEAEEKGVTFDMYHFFSRKDVLLVALVIFGLLIYVLFRLMTMETMV